VRLVCDNRKEEILVPLFSEEPVPYEVLRTPTLVEHQSVPLVPVKGTGTDA
jgi:hypothetical protein